MLFLMISRKSYFSLLKLKEFLSCPDWRWFVLNRGVFKPPFDVPKLASSSTSSSSQLEGWMQFVHSGTRDGSIAF